MVPLHTYPDSRPQSADCLLFTADCLLLFLYAEERGAGGPGSLIEGGASVGGAGRHSSKMARPRLVLRQRENSWQYFANSWAASLWANSSSGDKSGNESDGMKTSKGKSIITFSVGFKRQRKSQEGGETGRNVSATKSHCAPLLLSPHRPLRGKRPGTKFPSPCIHALVLPFTPACRLSIRRGLAGVHAAPPQNLLP